MRLTLRRVQEIKQLVSTISKQVCYYLLSCLYLICLTVTEIRKLADHKDHVKSVTFTPGGLLVTTSTDNSVRIYGIRALRILYLLVLNAVL